MVVDYLYWNEFAGVLLCWHDSAIQIDQEGEEAGVVINLRSQEVALVLVVWVGETTKNLVTTDQEAMISISEVLDKTASWETE